MVLEAARQVPDTDRKTCITLMLAVASEAARHAMEAKMATPAYRNDFIESFEAKGRAEGRAETLGAAIMKALAARRIRVDKMRAEQVQSCADLNQLNVVSAARLPERADKDAVRVAGLVLVRQRPPTANGTVFMTLEDETGLINLIIWARTWERYRKIAAEHHGFVPGILRGKKLGDAAEAHGVPVA